MKSESFPLRWIAVVISIFVVATALATFGVLSTLPPRTIVMATGPEGGAYNEVGKKYQAALASEGVSVRLMTTTGALENLGLLRDPRSGVSVALLQGGTIDRVDEPDLQSLGTLFYEPLWVFYRRGLPNLGSAVTFEGLEGRIVSLGPEGSGGRMLSLELLRRNAAEHLPSQLLSLPPQEAADQLVRGDIDAAFVSMAWDGPAVQQLIANENIELSSFARVDAYVALFPFLSKVVVPAGVGNLAKQRPPSDVTLLAPKASLSIRKDLHSAVQYLLLNAAMQIHSGAGIFQRASEFPAAEVVDLPLSSEAAQFYKSGSPFLHNQLPFWMASMFGRLLVITIPLIAIVYPMVRYVPALYNFFMRAKVARLYGELRFLEDEIEGDAGSSGLRARLDELERQASKLRLPMRYASMMYLLRDHIALVRERLKRP
ncbi:MAG: TAXI family TRAP transporter solute-binding subunit [Xanthobacteraceae bacterium]